MRAGRVTTDHPLTRPKHSWTRSADTILSDSSTTASQQDEDTTARGRETRG
jgi:hypothetical protein